MTNLLTISSPTNLSLQVCIGLVQCCIVLFQWANSGLLECALLLQFCHSLFQVFIFYRHLLAKINHLLQTKVLPSNIDTDRQYGISQLTSHQSSRALADCFDCRDVIKICGQLWSQEQPYMKFWASFSQNYRFKESKLIRKLRIRFGFACWNRKI